MSLRIRAADAFFRRRAVREVAALLSKRRAPDLAHLTLFHEHAHGPLQRDEALFLFGLIRTIRPRTVVEVGFLRGHSALNVLRALDADAHLYAFDIARECVEWAERRFAGDPRLTLRIKSQTEIAAEDVDGRPIDFVFLDGAHDLALNQQAFLRLEPLLAPRAIIAIHDTGVVAREQLPPDHWLQTFEEGWTEEGWEGQPGERAFVNWLGAERPEYALLHVHTTRVVRHGITLVQRSGPLPRPPDGRTTEWPA